MPLEQEKLNNSNIAGFSSDFYKRIDTTTSNPLNYNLSYNYSSNEEFIDWLRGFADAVAETPTPEQWNKIKEKLKNINNYKFPLQDKIPHPFPINEPYNHPGYPFGEYPKVID